MYYNSLFYLLRKPKTQKGKRILEKREAKIIEDVKSTIIIRGGRTSDIVTDALKNIVGHISIQFLSYY